MISLGVNAKQPQAFVGRVVRQRRVLRARKHVPAMAGQLLNVAQNCECLP
jgi:hypothetical protein